MAYGEDVGALWCNYVRGAVYDSACVDVPIEVKSGCFFLFVRVFRWVFGSPLDGSTVAGLL